MTTRKTTVLTAVLFIFIGGIAWGLTHPFYTEYEGWYADIQKLPVQGVSDNLSSLTWNQQTGTLFATINKPPRIIELSVDGKLLRTVHLNSETPPDLESIEYIDGNRYLLTDERRRRLYIAEITGSALSLDVKQLPFFSLDINDNHNNSGYEGLAWDHEHKTLFIAQEKKPVALTQIQSPAFLYPNTRHSGIRIHTDTAWMHNIRDISGLDYSRIRQRMLILSDESRKILLMAPDYPVQQVSLTRGLHGLREDIPQPEGVATDNNGTLYVVSEPNLFYRFSE